MKKLAVLGLLVMCLMAIISGTGSGTADAEMKIEITVSPNTLNLESEGTWVTVHTDIPYGSVETLSLELNGIDVAWTKSDSKGYLVAKFNLDDVKGIIAPPDAELTLSGTTKDGISFEGTDIIEVIDGPRK